MRLRRLHPCLVAVLLCFALWLIAPARLVFAFDSFDLEVEPYQIEEQSEFALEWLQSAVPKGHDQADDGAFPTHSMYRTSIGLEYGLTSHIEAVTFLDLARADGASLQYAGGRFHLHGRLFSENELPLNLGWYAEIDMRCHPQFAENNLELALRPIY